MGSLTSDSTGSPIVRMLGQFLSTLFPIYFLADPLSPVPFVTVPSNPEESTVGLTGSAQLYRGGYRIGDIECPPKFVSMVSTGDGI